MVQSWLFRFSRGGAGWFWVALAVIGECRPTVRGGVGWLGAEAEGDPSDVLDDAVVALAAGVGQPGGDSQDHRVLPAGDGGGEGVDLGHGAGGAEGVEGVEAVQGRTDLIP